MANIAETIRNAWKIRDLRRRIIFTLAMLALFRLGAFIPVPGVDPSAISKIVSEGGLLGILNLFSGGTLLNFGLLSLGVLPYINASIILNLLQMVIPKLKEMAKEEGEGGRRKLAIWTRYLCVALGVLESIFFLVYMQRSGVPLNPDNFLTQFAIVVTLTAGAMLTLWLGEEVTEKGIGNGVSLIIFIGIVARILPGAIEAGRLIGVGEMPIPELILVLAISVCIMAGVVVAYTAERKVPVQYAKRVVGRRMYGGQSTFIPLRLIQAGVLPIIFAQAVLMFPVTLAGFIPGLQGFAQLFYDSTSWLYNSLLFLLIVFFTYFYTEISFNPHELADNLQKYGGFVPGIRPGPPTATYFQRVLNRITLPASVFLGILAILPNFLMPILGIAGSRFLFGGTSILIVIGVALETVKQIEAFLVMRHYEGFLR
ncbi:MAG: preprotein translocase subunit SecY [Coprothermobacterota bacterium]|nr:preprotein translocase subunit SecY [Coprothermobacterota bacterium]